MYSKLKNCIQPQNTQKLRRKTQSTTETFRYSNASSNVRVSLIGNETFQEKCSEISRDFKALRKAKQDQEVCEKEFSTTQIKKQSRAGVFFVVKYKEAKVD